jgi:hypothetical protein
MSAIEYGSYYWGVVLHAERPDAPGQTVHLHADQMKIDPSGALLFTSAGRRPAGANPDQQGSSKDEKEPQKTSGKDEKSSKDEKGGKGDESADKGITYVAFAAGTWKSVYAAKLQDGLPAAVEHWTSFDGKPQLPEMVTSDAGAPGRPA